MDEKLPLISVIVPVYNGQDYLENCIESIESQTYDNLEIIVVNDGSLDATDVVCDRLRESYDNVYVFTLDDKGVSAARNTGLKAAQGELITFVDADDRLRPKTLKVLYNCIMATKADAAGCGFHAWSLEEEWQAFLSQKYRIPRAVKYNPSEFLEEQLLKGNSRCWSKLYRRKAVGDLRFQTELSIGEDMLFLLHLLPGLKVIAETDYPGYGYFQNPAGVMNREFLPGYMDQITCWEIAREEIAGRAPSRCGGQAEGLSAQATAILMMSIMLTAGKLALLSSKERKGCREYICICRDKIRKELGTPGAYERLSRGYQVKTKLFAAAPGVYLWLYHLLKLGKG